MRQCLFSFIHRCALVFLLIVSVPLLDMHLLQKSGWWGVILLLFISIYLLRHLLLKPEKQARNAKNVKLTRFQNTVHKGGMIANRYKA